MHEPRQAWTIDPNLKPKTNPPPVPLAVIRTCLRVLGDVPQTHGICLCRDETCPRHLGKWRCGRIFELDDPTSRVNRCCPGAPCAGGAKRVRVEVRDDAQPSA